jgi:hypothetical protein
MITQIVVHLLPHEIDWFEWQSKQFKLGSYYLNKDDTVIIDVTLNLNFIDWEVSKIPKLFFINKFNQIKKLWDWAEIKFEIDNEQKCLGCGDKRKQSINESTADNILYLDSDIFFKPESLNYIIEASKLVTNKYYIISPQIVRLWDMSWDILVNQQYMNIPASSENYDKNDPFLTISRINGDVTLRSVNEFKLGGGWFNLFSVNLLKLTDIPDGINPYGPDDTYVMYCCNIMKQKGYDVQQFVLEEVVITENIKYRYNPYSEFLSSNDEISDARRKDFRKKAEMNLIKEVENFIINLN